MEAFAGAATITYALDCGRQHIVALDADEHGNYLAVLDNGEVCTPHGRLTLGRRFQFPLIRRVDAGRFVVVEGRYYRQREANAYLFTTAGEQVGAFEVGNYVQDVLVQAGRLVVSHFDQAAGEPSPTGEGLGVFDLSGELLFGYNSSGRGHWMLDCYAMCPHGADSVLFYAYTDFNLQELRLTDLRLQQWPAPPDFRGAHALTPSRQHVIFWGSYDDDTGFYWWDRQQRVTRFGHVAAAPMRGIGNGKFLTHDARSFTIIDALALADAGCGPAAASRLIQDRWASATMSFTSSTRFW